MIDCYVPIKNVVFPPISGARPVVVACWACPGSSDSLATIRIPMQVYNFDTVYYRIEYEIRFKKINTISIICAYHHF